MMKQVLITSIYLLAFGLYVQAQQHVLQDKYAIEVIECGETVTIDGVLDEAIWQQAKPADHFTMHYPVDGKTPQMNTEVRMASNGDLIYISAKCFTAPGQELVINNTKRDESFWSSEAFAIILDPVNSATNGFFFGLNAIGVQYEALIMPFVDEPDWAWDNKWFSETKQYDDHWVAELAIPLRSLRYELGKPTWGINFIRSDLTHNEYATWTDFPIAYPGFDLAYTGKMNWQKAPDTRNQNISVIPYLTAEAVEPDEGPVNNADLRMDAGVDAKIALGSSLNLDLTINPDFSQVEVDVQQANLTRFSLFFPERRNFFLENSDLLSRFGPPPARPFFSRRIGLDADGNAVPILGGVRLSGNIAPKTRIVGLSMQTKPLEGGSENYSAFAFNQQVLKRSQIKAYALNRQSFDAPSDATKSKYGRNIGTEWVYQNQSGSWTAWSAWHESFTPGLTKDKSFQNLGLFYNTKQLTVLFDVINIGNNYRADMGFIPRLENYDQELDSTVFLGFRTLYTFGEYSIFPKKGIINRHQWGIENSTTLNPDYSTNEQFNRLRYFVRFNNASELQVRIDYNAANLLFPFSFTDSEPLPKQYYDWWQWNVNYESDYRKPFIWSVNAWAGGFYNGSRLSPSMSAGYRFQPLGSFSMNLEYNKLDFPDPYGSAELWLVGSRIEINFSKNCFWNTFVQLNTQNDNLNINSRLQWRYAPMSDLFLVYTNNFQSDGFLSRNRALVLKLSYWLNL